MLLIGRNRFYKWDEKKETLDLAAFGLEEESRYYFKEGALVFRVAPHDRTASQKTGSHGTDAMADGKTAQILRNSDYFLKAARSGKATVDAEAFIKGSPPGK